MDKIPERPPVESNEMLDQLDLVDDELKLAAGMITRLIPKTEEQKIAEVRGHVTAARLRLVRAIEQLREVIEGGG